MKGTFLYQLDFADLGYASFLLGTMHVKDQRAFNMLPAIQSCINQCDTYFAEVSLEELHSSPDKHQLAMQLPDGQELTDFLPEKKFEKVRRMLQKGFGIDIAMLKGKRPIIITSFIDQSILRGDHPLALDEVLWHYAKDQGKALGGIETPQEQQQIMLAIPIKTQVKALLDISKNVAKHRQRLGYMADLYAAGNIRQLHRSSKKGLGKERNLLLYRRNSIMAERIYETIFQQSAFCSIGAGHLWGEKGVLRKLKKKGATITPLPWNDPKDRAMVV